MKRFEIKFSDHLSKEISDKRDQGHTEYETLNNINCNYKKFAIVIRNEEGVFGVLEGYTAFAEVYIDDLWVDKEYRGKGYGRMLIKGLEDRFKGKGYNNINVYTSQFAAPEFYKKCSFEEEYVRVNTHNPQFTKTFFIKFFDEEVQTQGILNSNTVIT